MKLTFEEVKALNDIVDMQTNNINTSKTLDIDRNEVGKLFITFGYKPEHKPDLITVTFSYNLKETK